MYSSFTPSMWAVTCHECRKPSDSSGAIGTFHVRRFRITVVGRLCHVTMMSA